MSEKTETKEIMDTAVRATEPQYVDDHPILVAPEDTLTLSLEKFGRQPIAHAGTGVFSRVESFIEYVQEFKTPPTKLYVNEPRSEVPRDNFPSFLALFDDKLPSKPAWGRFSASFAVERSRQLSEWLRCDSKMLNPKVFAEFIHKNRLDVIDPDAAALIEILRDIKGTANVEFAEAVDAHTGAKSKLYAEKVTLKGAKSNVDVPTGFTIAVPIYRRQANRVRINCHLVAEVVEGKVLFSYEMDQVDEIVETVCDNLIDDVAKETQLKAYYGNPAING